MVMHICSAYYASIMLNAVKHLLCSLLCQHNRRVPTHSISARLASISIVIPYIHVLIRTLEKNEGDSGICTMKSQILHSLRTRFTGVEYRKELALTTLDPWFEDRFFFGGGGGYYKGYCKGIVVR